MTFIEVLFAVIILGVGFIMIAGVFPVAIQQTQSNIDESTASALARGAVQTLMNLNMRSYNPNSGSSSAQAPAYSIRDGDPSATLNMWRAVRGNVISVADPRYAWVAFYVCPNNASYARIDIVVTRCRNQSIYNQYDDTDRWPNDLTSGNPATLEGQLLSNISIQSYPDPLNPSTDPLNPRLVYYLPDSKPGAHGNSWDAVASMAYLIVQTDSTNAGATNGYIFRIGNYDPTHQGWQLLPGNDLTGLITYASGSPQVITGISGNAYIVGRGYSIPRSPGNFDGPAQDVAAYTTFIPMF
jgi:Tfp pilus assembly protein PilV